VTLVGRVRDALLARKMRRDWDSRAKANPRHYICDGQEQWTEQEFYDSGERSVAEQILNDMGNVCQGKDPARMRVLEIGCGAGRVTQALARRFGEVHAVDVSGEMVRLAREACAGLRNVHIYRNNGRDVSVVGGGRFDFAYSMCVFHHVSSLEVIESYLRSVHDALEPGALFKFEVQGCTSVVSPEGDTWIGAPVSDAEAVRLAERCGFDPRYRHGAGEERFWLWFFRKG
jgi:SAM-dependent methyltransferase